MKKIVVVGLGIIGGSICASLTAAGYPVDGFESNPQSVEYALKAGYIQSQAKDLSQYDVVFIAVPPQATIEYLDKAVFKDGALVADICGVKEIMEKTVYAKQRNYRYVGLHPMAGKEVSGIVAASATLFQKANLIITRAKQTDIRAIDEVQTYAKAMGFGNIIECSASKHDKKIALTSQLAHIVSNAYVKSPQVKDYEGFTGGSFQDMTRIAGVDENVWTPLYVYNRDNVITELNLLIDNLTEYRDALTSQDDERLKQTLRQGRLIREKIKKNN